MTRTAAQVDQPRTPTIVELVENAAYRDPDAIAVRFAGREVSYRELIRMADAITAALRARGIGQGDLIAVRVGAGIWNVAALLGVLGAGAALVSVRTDDIGQSGKDALATVRPACLLIAGDPQGDALAAWFRSTLAASVIDVTATAASPEVATRLARPLTERAYVVFTSGTTGAPKAIPMTHAALAQLVLWFTGEFGITAGTRVAQWAQAGYDAALVETFAALAVGGTLCPVPDKIKANPDKLVIWMTEENIAVFQTVPSFARALVTVIGETEPARRPRLSHLLLAGEELSASLANEIREVLPHVRLANLYGPTECILATWCEIRERLGASAPIGRAIPGRWVLVLDEHDQPCPRGEVGEIIIGSRYLTSGYLGAGAATSFSPPAGASPEADGQVRWFRTGDRGRLRTDGFLEFTGRSDAQVKLLGNRLELSEVEAVLIAHPGIADCVVLAQTGDTGLVVRLNAYVVSRPDIEADSAELRAHLRKRFGAKLLPVKFYWLPELPRNLGGKVDRRALTTGWSAAQGYAVSA